MQVENDVEAGGMQVRDEADNGSPVVFPGGRGIPTVDAEPAVFVERDTDHIGMPAGDSSRRLRGRGEGEDAFRRMGPGRDALGTARDVDPDQTDGLSLLIDDLVTGDTESETGADCRAGCGRRGRRRGGGWARRGSGSGLRHGDPPGACGLDDEVHRTPFGHLPVPTAACAWRVTMAQ